MEFDISQRNAEIGPEEASPLAPPEPSVDLYMPLRIRRTRRLQSVDVLRGYTLMAMIFVNHSGSWPAWLPHAAWDGVHVADFVMPCFLFTVGVSIALSVLPAALITSPSHILHKIATRTGKLFLLGVFIQGGVSTGLFPYFNLATLRIMGVLQRIAVSYMIAAVLIVLVRQSACSVSVSVPDQAMRLRRAAGQAMMPLMIVSALWFTVYAASTMLVRVPSCPHVVPAITPNCNVAAFVDCQLLGPNHMYPNPTCRQAEPPCPAFDPEGLYTTLGGAILSTLAGVLAGCVVHVHSSHQGRLLCWLVPSASSCAAGIVLHVSGTMPLNKNLYSPSYVLLTGGTSGLLLSLVYWLTEVAGLPGMTAMAAPGQWLGMNSIAVYAGDEIGDQMLGWVYYKEPAKNLKALLAVACQLAAAGTPAAAPLLLAFLDVVFWVLARHLYNKRIFFKI